MIKNIIALITVILTIVSCTKLDTNCVDYKKTVTQHKWKKYEYVDTCTQRYAVVHDWNGRCGVYDLKKKQNLTELEYRDLSLSKVTRQEDGSDIAVFMGYKGYSKRMITFIPSGYSTTACLLDYNLIYTLDSCRTIDPVITSLCKNLLEEDMKEAEGIYGQVFVMESHTGNIKAWIALEDAVHVGSYTDAPLYKKQLCSTPLKSVAAIYSLAESNTSWSDSVDTKSGIDTIGDMKVMDNNWYKGGYGKVSLLDGFKLHSDIAMAHAMEKTEGDNLKRIWNEFTNNPRTYDAMEIAAIYNTIALEGKSLVMPSVNTDSIMVLPQENSQEKDVKISKMTKEYLKATLQDGGIGSAWTTKNVDLSGDYVVQLNCCPTLYDDNINEMEKYYSKEGLQTYSQLIFTGYFPSDNPRYTICVTMDKKEKPINGKLISRTVNGIVEYLDKH